MTEHSVFEFIPSRLEKVIYRKRVRTCLDCGRSAECPTPGATPNCLYGNSTVANALVEHYVHGTTAGGVTRWTGIGGGAKAQRENMISFLSITLKSGNWQVEFAFANAIFRLAEELETQSRDFFLITPIQIREEEP